MVFLLAIAAFSFLPSLAVGQGFSSNRLTGFFGEACSGCGWPSVFGFANLAQRTEVVIFSGFRGNLSQASVAQLAEQLICNQQVVGSSPSASSSVENVRLVREY